MASSDEKIDYDNAIESNHPGALLPKLWRKIRDTIGVPKSRFSVLVQEYVWLNFKDATSTKITSTIHNYIDAYLYAHMTWIVFLRGFDILRMHSVTLSMHVRFTNPKLRAASASRTVFFEKSSRDSKPANALIGLKEGKRALKQIYDSIQYDSGMTPQMSDELFRDYLEQAHLPSDSATLSHMRGNINKELKREIISWPVLIKLLAYLSAGVIDIGIHATRQNSTTYSTYLKVVINADALDDDE